ncbi:zinc finger, CCHC-type containing protein [Tanacetum coccineum]
MTSRPRTQSRDAIFDENHFSSIPRPKDVIPNLDESQRDDHFDDVPSETPRPSRGKRARKAKSYGSDFQQYLVEGLRDHPLGYKWVFKRKMKVDGTIYKFKARLVIQGFRQKEGINYFDTYAPVARITTIRLLLALEAIHNLVIHQMDVKTTFLNCDLNEEVYMKQPGGFIMPGNEHKASTPMDLVEKIKPNIGKPVDQLKYSKAIGCLMYAITSTRPDIAYAVGRLSIFTSNTSRQHWQAITRMFKFISYEWMGIPAWGGAISWAFKKQTCITGSTMESEFVALAATGKEAEWLRNLIHEILIWSKPIAPISIHCESAATLATTLAKMHKVNMYIWASLKHL